MFALPIVQRELRAGAKRRGTYRLRSLAALIAGVAICVVTIRASSRTPLLAGSTNLLFSVLSACAFGLCLVSGIFLTSDSLSQEKREGTLPLLFLTGLKGYDIVLGKFTGLSLNAIYGLLALLPVMGMTYV